MPADNRFDVVLLGATGFTGRQAVRALRIQAGNARWAIAGRNATALQALADEGPSAKRPAVLQADTGDAASLAAIAAQARVLLNVAGPYATRGDAVVEACIAHGAHYLDLTGETFWMQRLVRERHDDARRAGVKIIPCAGYEALPFDLATLWAAHRVRERFGQPCREVKIVVRFTGRRLRSLADAVSGGTAATMAMVLAHDHTDCLLNMGCLLPLGTPEAEAAAIARRNAIAWLPQLDADLNVVTAPTLPGPFINPPVLLRSVALAADATLFTPGFVYREGTNMAAMVPRAAWLPAAATLPLQWAAAAALSAPLANLGAVVAGPLGFERAALRKLLQAVSPKPGQGPSEAALGGSGYAFDLFARAADGQTLRADVTAQGHPGYRSTPDMLVCVGLGLAHGTLGIDCPDGVVTPATGLGLAAVAALRDAGVEFKLRA